MTRELEIKQLNYYFSVWIAEIRVNNYVTFYDINKISEGLACQLLNLLYGYNLLNLNDEKKNMYAVDLGDREKKIAFQITSRTDGKKIEETLEKFKENKLDEEYSNGIKFLILSNEPVKLGKTNYCKIYNKFNKDEDIITEKDIIKEFVKVYDTNCTAFQNILELFREQFSSNNVKDDISDNEILEKMARCLDRPAFITPFYCENNFGDFRKAIDDTIEAINTGVYRLRDGTLIEKIYPKAMIKDDELRNKVNDVILDLMKLRNTYDTLNRKGEINRCECGNRECNVSIWSRIACDKMDNIRKDILKKFREIYPKFSTRFIDEMDILE